MTQQLIVTTPANTGTGDSPKAAFDKINAMFTELYGIGSGSAALISYTPPFTGGMQTTVATEFTRQWITPEDFGAKGDGTTDDGTALTNWINALVAGPNTFGKIQAKTYCTSVLLPQINASGVQIYGAGADNYHVAPGVPGTSQTFIKWIGSANSGSIMTVSPTAGAANYLVGNKVLGICFLCQSLVGTGITVQSVTSGEFDCRAEDATVSGITLSVTTLTSDPADLQLNKFRLRGSQVNFAAPCLTITGNVSHNVSFNIFEILEFNYSAVPAIQFANCDSNLYLQTRLFYAGGAATNSCVFQASATSANLTARDELFVTFYSGQPGLAQTNTFPAESIRFIALNLGNGAVPPTAAGDQRQVSWQNDNSLYTGAWQAYTPAVTAGSGAFGSSPPTATGRFIITNNICNFTAVVTFAAANSVGSAGTSVNVSLPVTASASLTATTIAGSELSAGSALVAKINAGGTIANIFKYDGVTFYGANSYVLAISGSYEIQPLGT